MIGPGYWSTGITIRWDPDPGGRWHVSLEFLDDGFCQDGSTEGTLRGRYFEGDLTKALDTLIADAERLGIRWERPTLYVPGDGEDEDEDYPEDWRAILRDQAKRLGWDTTLYAVVDP